MLRDIATKTAKRRAATITAGYFFLQVIFRPGQLGYEVGYMRYISTAERTYHGDVSFDCCKKRSCL